MKKVLLCPPLYYDIEYEINPWMHIENKVDKKKAQEEFQELVNIYKKLHVSTLKIPQEQGLPDMVYAANYGFPKGKFFIKSNFKYPQRKKEASLAKDYFTQTLGFTVVQLPEDIVFEGQGDLLTIGGMYFFGFGMRSDFAAKEYLEQFLGIELIDFKLSNPYYYHLDTCFAPLDLETVVINPVSFEEKELATIKSLFKNVISASEKDNNVLACNLVVADKTIVISKGITNELKQQFEKYGFAVAEVPMDEFRKGGGSVKCLTLEFYSSS